jgi:hypothetical protein
VSWCNSRRENETTFELSESPKINAPLKALRLWFDAQNSTGALAWQTHLTPGPRGEWVMLLLLLLLLLLLQASDVGP